jgi:hypothetical protein
MKIRYLYFGAFLLLATVMFVGSHPRPVVSGKPSPIPAQTFVQFRTTEPHSFIRGGIRSVAQFQLALNADAALAAQFPGFDFARAHFEVLQKPECAFVAYRTGNQFAWTKKCLWLKAGELILTDGHYRVRAKCGNLLAFTPQVPTLPDGFSGDLLDLPEPIASTETTSQEQPVPPIVVTDIPVGSPPPVLICCPIPITGVPVKVPDHGDYTGLLAGIVIAVAFWIRRKQ